MLDIDESAFSEISICIWNNLTRRNVAIAERLKYLKENMAITEDDENYILMYQEWLEVIVDSVGNDSECKVLKPIAITAAELGDVQYLQRIYDSIFTAISPKLDREAFGKLRASTVLNVYNFIDWGSSNGLDGGKQNAYFELFHGAYSRCASGDVQRAVCDGLKKKQTVSEFAKKLIALRVQHLKTLTEPVFSWKMNGDNVKDLEFAQFLKSEKTQFEKRGFRGIADARSWASNNGQRTAEWNPYFMNRWSRGEYTVKASPGGRGKTAYVLVVKTRDYFENVILRKYNHEMHDLTVLSALLDHNKDNDDD